MTSFSGSTVCTRLPGPDADKKQRARPRRDVAYKRIHVDSGQNTAWTVFPMKLPTVGSIQNGMVKSQPPPPMPPPPPTTYKYWKRSQNISKGANVKTKLASMEDSNNSF